MTLEYSTLYEGNNFTTLHSEIDAAVLSAQVNEERHADSTFELSRLSIAANTATAELFDHLSLEGIGRGDAENIDTENSSEHDVDILKWAVAHWRAYLEGLMNADEINRVSIADLVCFVACGALNKQQSEVRTLLKNEFFRQVVNAEYDKAKQSSDWLNTCETYISCAVLFLVRQSNHDDIKAATEAVEQLIKLQHEKKSEISKLVRTQSGRTGYAVLGFYHLAQAAIRTSEYLVSGHVKPQEGSATNFELELRRLLTKAEEFIEETASSEYLLWTRAVGMTLWTIFDQSIWRQARGLSGTIDELLNELSNRDHPIFSLLPSQQEALKSHLLDTAQIAVVLQMPTSAGKTLLAEFSILQTFEAYKDNTRVLYIAPTRALCTQVFRTLATDFAGLNIAVQQASSAFEEDPFEASLLSDFKSGVVVSTPEKVDLFLRAHPEWFKTVRLIVVDEAHLLSESERGVRLELLLANIRREQSTIRFLLLTPFVQNAQAVAKWLGGSRGLPIRVHWRPSRLLVGLATRRSKKKKISFTIEWKEPHSEGAVPDPLTINMADGVVANSAREKVVALNTRFQRLGLTLGMFPGSRTEAEKAARAIAEGASPVNLNRISDEYELALALAEAEYGASSTLAYCLRHGTAFHHGALSPELRFLIEELGRTRKLHFLAATTTLAQGINFPVSTVLVHSIHKPRAGGDLSPSEFWNIAGRAGRVGLADKGLIVFVNSHHREKWERYSAHLDESILSALLGILTAAMAENSLKDAYRAYPQIRPFMQYLAHAAVTMTPKGAMASLEEIIEASFASAVSTSRDERRMMRELAARYLSEISGKTPGYLRIADTTGFGSFSFDEIYAKIASDNVLSAGPGEILGGGITTLQHLVDMLAYLPELDLALGLGVGRIDTAAVARVIDGWMSGQTVEELAVEFGGTEAERLRNAGTYLFSTVSQRISWGAHAYIKGWHLRKGEEAKTSDARELMLAAYIQHGVNTPEAAVASLFGVPRLVAEPIATVYREREGQLSPENVPKFRTFIEGAEETVWVEAINRSRLSGKIDPAKARAVWRRMRGLPI